MKNTKLKIQANSFTIGAFLRPVLFSCIMLLLFSCSSAQQPELAELKNEKFSLEDTANKPNVNFKVNKQYDKNGKMIKYDSTYSYVYSGTGNRHANDSAFKQFQKYFNLRSDGIFEHDGFFSDSLFNHKPFNNNFFEQRLNLNRDMFDYFYKDLDSLRQSFFAEPKRGNTKKKV